MTPWWRGVRSVHDVAVIVDTPLFLDVPEANPAAVALAQRHQMRPVFETARMYRGGRPHDDVGRVYGVTSFEFG